jgi:hypothetical protein
MHVFPSSRRDRSRRQPTATEVPLTELVVRAGRRLCTERECVRQFVAVIEGSAIATVDGRPVAMLGPGSCVGWPEVVNAAPAPATVTLTSTSHLLVLRRVECSELFDDSAAVGDLIARLRRDHVSRSRTPQTLREDQP